MMMNVLSRNDWGNRVCFLGWTLGTRALELKTLLFQTSLDRFAISVNVLTRFHFGHLMMMLFRKYLPILHRLNWCVIMILMDLTVNCGRRFHMSLLRHILLDNGRSHLLMDGGIMMPRLVPIHVRSQKQCTVITPYSNFALHVRTWD